MKILSAKQIREADQHTIKNEPVSSIDLMERAAVAFTNWFTGLYPHSSPVKIFCGPGNNGGDGLAIARLLHRKGYNVQVFVVRYSDRPSADFRHNERRLNKILTINNIHENDPLPKLTSGDVAIDALFGSGLNRPVEGFPARIIEHINKSGAAVVAVDIPSSLFADRHSEGVQINAGFTVTFELPKLSFLFPESYSSVGRYVAVPIGLDHDFIQKQESNNFLITEEHIRKIYRQRLPFSHKGTYGKALLISGSYGKIGAAVLAARGCMKAGAGSLVVHLPRCGYSIMQTALPEAMVMADKNEQYLTELPEVEKFDVVGIGPGIGTEEETQKMFESLLKDYKKPLVIDADGLNILAKNKNWLQYLPPKSILTPHPKEFERLTGKAGNDFERWEMQKKFAKDYHIYLVLKGYRTCIACPEGRSWFNTTGNPGMATAGSGDVLTGIITGLLAQGYTPEDAAVLGVFIHGLAGDLAACKNGMDALLAGEIADSVGAAFQSL